MSSSSEPFVLPAAAPGGRPLRAHAMGVCGVGVAGVAAWLARKGWEVTGCDADADGRTARWLREQGVAVFGGHDPAHVGPGCDLLVRTAAVPADHPEARRAAELGIPAVPRGLVLAALLGGCRSVAVCGTHGKTTTTVFTTRLLRALGEDAGWCIGGTAEGLDGYSGGGLSPGSVVVAESDESDGTLAAYRPHLLVVNNVEFDHMEHFDGEADLLGCFAAAARATRAGVVFGADDARAREVAAKAPAGLPRIGFGLGEGADLRATALRMDAAGTTFRIEWRGRAFPEARVPAPGRHNVLNALAAAAAALCLGHAPEKVFAALGEVGPLPARRFDVLADAGGIRVVSDYSHHPTEIAALVETAKLQGARRVLALFQPHRHTRTKALGPDFPRAFRGVDALVIAPVYAASEAPTDGGHSTDLYARFREAGFSPVPLLAPSHGAAGEYLRRELREGDLLLVVGAGDVVRTARDLADAVRRGEVGDAAPAAARPVRADAPASGNTAGDAGGAGKAILAGEAAAGEAAPAGPRPVSEAALRRRLAAIPGLHVEADVPLGRLTGYGVGGKADILATPGDEGALAALLEALAAFAIPWRILGGGANTLVGDLGAPGVTIRLDAPAFRGFEIVEAGGDGGENGGESAATRAAGGAPVLVRAGAGWSGPALLDRLEAEGVGGLEFLDGVPGRLGGWLAMNAGAHGDEIGRHVSHIRCLNGDGRCAILSPDALSCGYRSCPGLSGRVALAAVLALRRDSPEAIGRRRAAFRGKRVVLRGLRTDGSVFRNPEGDHAGRSLDAAGCKGLRVGGAAVLERHANVIAAEAGATASDLLAAIDLARRRALAVSGVPLMTEVRILDRAPWPGCE